MKRLQRFQALFLFFTVKLPRMGSSPISRTKEIKGEIVFDKKRSYLFYFL